MLYNKFMKNILAIYPIALLLLLGCSNNVPTPQERLNTALFFKNKESIQTTLKMQNFELFTIKNISKECKNISIYIEGDGLAWITTSQISNDPTPINPIALKLMLIDANDCKIYLARPCQYTPYAKNCEDKYWTSHRFNRKIIDDYNEALNLIKQEYKNDSFSLVGYSGGATIALLTAAQREDILKIITVAGNLNHTFWTQYHHINSLTGSLNPINYAKQLEKIPQYHLIGLNDSIMPKAVFDSYIAHFKDTRNINSKTYTATHTENWEQNYRDFLREINEQ